MPARHRTDRRFVARMLAIDRRRRRQLFAAHLTKLCGLRQTEHRRRQHRVGAKQAAHHRRAIAIAQRAGKLREFAIGSVGRQRREIAVRHQGCFIERINQRELIASAQERRRCDRAALRERAVLAALAAREPEKQNHARRREQHEQHRARLADARPCRDRDARRADADGDGNPKEDLQRIEPPAWLRWLVFYVICHWRAC